MQVIGTDGNEGLIVKMTRTELQKLFGLDSDRKTIPFASVNPRTVTSGDLIGVSDFYTMMGELKRACEEFTTTMEKFTKHSSSMHNFTKLVLEQQQVKG